MRGPFLWSRWCKLLVKWLYVLGYTCPVVPAWTEPPFHPASILDGAINPMITLAISVHAYGIHRWYSADLRQLSDYCATFVCLSFWCHIRKQIISPSTQIIGEKPQTVSGPLWVIIHPIVVLALMMVSCAVQKVIYAARHCLMALQHWGKLEGGVQGIVTSPLLSSFTSISDPPHFVRGCGFSVIPFRWSQRMGLGVGVEGWRVLFDLLSQTAQGSIASFHYLCVQTFLMDWLIYTFPAWMQREKKQLKSTHI